MQRMLLSLALGFTMAGCSDSLDSERTFDHAVSAHEDVHGVKGVYAMKNLTRVEIRDPRAKVVVREYNHNGDAFHIPHQTLIVSLSGGKTHTVSDKGAGNGELIFDGDAVKGSYFVLGPSGQFEAIEPPTAGALELAIDSLKEPQQDQDR